MRKLSDCSTKDYHLVGEQPRKSMQTKGKRDSGRSEFDEQPDHSDKVSNQYSRSERKHFLNMIAKSNAYGTFSNAKKTIT